MSTPRPPSAASRRAAERYAHRRGDPWAIDPNHALATLDLARYEVANVAVCAWRAPELVGPLLGAVDRLADDGGVIASTGSLLADAAQLADRHAISVYDAAYAAAARERGLSLISCDERDLVTKGLATFPAAPPSDR